MHRLFVLILCVPLITWSQDSLKTKTDSVLFYAKSQIGTPYEYATSSPGKSFDCSGFVSYVYESCSIENTRSSKGYGLLGEAIELTMAKPGDCILFTGTDPKIRTIGHVGIVVENSDEGLFFIHCSSSKKHFGVVITDYENSGYPKRFMEVRRMY